MSHNNPSGSTTPIAECHKTGLKPQDSDAISFRSRKSTNEESAVHNVQDRHMTFLEFMELYKAFSIRMRKDLRDIFNELGAKNKTAEKATLQLVKSTSSLKTPSQHSFERVSLDSQPSEDDNEIRSDLGTIQLVSAAVAIVIGAANTIFRIHPKFISGHKAAGKSTKNLQRLSNCQHSPKFSWG